jgi:hypothetical protein
VSTASKYSWREISGFLAALRLTPKAQKVRSLPLPRVTDMMWSPSSGGVSDPGAAVRAAQRACSRWARWFGGIDTCLTRSLVAGALLAGDHEVVLQVGFRPTDRGAEAVDGHAWLEVDGERLELTGLDHEHEAPYETTLALPMEARHRKL